MPESKQAVHLTGSYLSNSAYRKIKRVLSFRRREYFKLLQTRAERFWCSATIYDFKNLSLNYMLMLQLQHIFRNDRCIITL